MGRKSSLRRLPPEILQEVNRLLSEGRATLAEILEHLRGMGVETVSLSALGRHKQQVDKVLERLRQTREFAETITQKLGPEAVEGKQGRALVQLLSALAGDYMMRRLNEPDGDTEAKEIMALARAVKDASQASRYSQDFELKLKEQVEKEVVAKLEAAARRAESEDGETRGSAQEAFARVLAIYKGEA